MGDVNEAKHTSMVDNSIVRRTVNKIPRAAANPRERHSSDDLRATEIVPPAAAAEGKWSHVGSLVSPAPTMPRLLGRPPGTWFDLHAPEFVPIKSGPHPSINQVPYECAASVVFGEEDECLEDDIFVSRSLQGLASVQLLYQTLGAL